MANTFPVGHAQWAINRNMKQNKHTCNECKSVFTDENMLHTHMITTHNGNFRNNCSQCSIAFDSKEDLNGHINQSHGEKFNIEATLLKMSEKFDTFSDRLQLLENKSLTNFPNLGPQLKEK